MKWYRFIIFICFIYFAGIPRGFSQHTTKTSCERMWIMPVRGQQANLWCYAAATQMILEYYEMNLTQCQIVAKIKDLPAANCANVVCDTDTHDSTDIMFGDLERSRFDDWIDEFRNWGFINTRVYEDEAITFAIIKNALDACKPVILTPRISNTATHALVIAGYIIIPGCPTALLLVKNPSNPCTGCESFMGYDIINSSLNTLRNSAYYTDKRTAPTQPSVKLIIPSK